MQKKIFLSVAAMLAVMTAGFWYNGAGGQQAGRMAALEPSAGGKPAAAAPIPVEVDTVSMQAVERSIDAVGNLISNESVVLSPEISGRVSEILFEEGQEVTKGTPLVRLDDNIYKAQLAEAQAQLPLAKANYERAKTLFAQQSGTGRARDESQAALNTVQAQIDLAQAQLAKSTMIAPFDGTIGLRSISVGNYVTPGQQLVNLESINPLKVDFKVAEVYLNLVKVGQKINLSIDAFPDRIFTGEVYAIDPRIESAGRTVLLRAKLPNDDGVLRPGLFARVRLVVEKREGAVIIPEQAIIPQGNTQYVYKVVEGKAVRVEVKTGQRTKGTVEITAGIAANDVVVIAGQMKLRPDAPVTVIEKGTTQ